jgi:hypothetical protein
MTTLLDLIKGELERYLAGVQPDFKKIPAQLINLMIEEAREDPEDAIAYINNVAKQNGQYDEDSDKDVEVASPKRGGGAHR